MTAHSQLDGEKANARLRQFDLDEAKDTALATAAASVGVAYAWFVIILSEASDEAVRAMIFGTYTYILMLVGATINVLIKRRRVRP